MFVLGKLWYETEWMRCELRRACSSPRLYYMMCREDTFCCFVIRVPVKTHISDSVSMNNTSKLYFFIIIVSVYNYSICFMYALSVFSMKYFFLEA